jgi:DMSO reductase family type II enzyme heme b subunit
VEKAGDGPVGARAKWEGGTWRVVLARPLAASGQSGKTVSLEVGKRVKIAFAIWDGDRGERGGLKSFSQGWIDLDLEP